MGLIVGGPSAISSQDAAGRSAIIGTFGDMMVSERKDQIGGVFTYDFPASNVVEVGSGLSSSGLDDSNLFIETTGVGSRYIETLTSVRYRASQMVYAYGTAVFNKGEVAGIYDYGLGINDDEDGFKILIKDGKFGVARYRTNRENRLAPIVREVDIFIPRESFNFDTLDGNGPSGYDITDKFDKGNIFMITFGYLGYTPITFSIILPNGNMVPFHQFNYTGTNEKTSVSVPYLPLRLEVNDPNGIGLKISTGSIAAGTLGGNGVDPQVREQSYTKLVSTSIASGKTFIAAFRQPQNYKDIKNKIGALLKSMNVVTDGAQGMTIKLLFNPTQTIAGTWTAVSATGPVEVSLDTEYNLDTGNEAGVSVALGKSDSTNFTVTDIIESRLRRGETAVFYAKANGNGTIDQWGITYNDEF